MIHNHGHSSFSQLDGVGSPSHRAAVAARLGHAGLALTDHGHLNGALAHRKACEKEGIIPIIGSEVYWRPDRSVRDKEWQYRRWHLILLAKNLAGWHNLIRLTSEAFSSGFYQNACVDWELQERYREGIICSTSCVVGPLAFLIENGSDAQVDEWVERALTIYGDDLFFSIMPHDFDRQRQHNLAVVSIANRHGCPIIHEKDSHYPEKGWVDTQKIAILVGINKTFAQAEEMNRKRIASGEEVYELWHDDLHISSEDEDREMYVKYHPDLPREVVDEAISNTEELLRRVDPILPDKTLKMPRAVKGKDPRKIVLDWCYEGLTRVGKRHDPVYEKQLEYEASVIDGQKAWGYFAFVGDVVRWARSDEPLPVTPEDPQPAGKKPIRLNSGRGSAAASIVCYLTRITMIDPIAHRFKFERFMNPERKSMPDIDIDIASSGRQLMKEYVARKYGRESVADIVAMQHFQPRAALQNVTRTIYGYDHQAFKDIAVLTHEDTGVVDPVFDTDLEALRERESRLAEWAEAWPEAWKHAVRLENAGDPSVLRLSKHAGAVVILPGKVTDVMPTIRADESEVGARTAWAETTRLSVADEIGVVKVDFLSLKGMDQQQMAVDAIAETSGEIIDLDALPVLRDPYDVDEDVMLAFRNGFTLGVNQLGGDGIRDFLLRARPENHVDLSAINALYRPGPLGSGGHNRYVKRKNGQEQIELPVILQPILGDTYSALCFQEQVMDLFEVLVGYSAGQADDIRKIIAKLYRDKGGLAARKLEEHREEFVAAATKLLGEEHAADLWMEVEPYCGYSFNRAHAGSYMVQAYQDMWLKVRYPLDFYAVLLTLEEKKTALVLREAREFGVAVLPPDVNTSGTGFTVVRRTQAIRYGLGGISGIGNAAAKQILADRPFASFDDFMERSQRKYSKVNKSAREKLLAVGALDLFGARDDWEASARAHAEMELLGVALEPGGLLGDDSEIVRENIFTEKEVADADEGDRIIIGGKVVELRKTQVKKGRQAGRAMAMLTISLDLDRWRAVCFPDSWDRYRSLIESGEMLMVAGERDSRGGVIVKQVMPLSDFIEDTRKEQLEVAA